MVAINKDMSSTKSEHLGLTPEDLFYIEFGAKVQRAQRALSGTMKGYLSIGGQSLEQIGSVLPLKQVRGL